MIIKFPTGLYKTALPQNPEDSGNVTFVISNEIPPRTNLIYPKIPPGIIDKRRPPRTLPILDRRNSLGALIFSVSKASRHEKGNNSREFETGQILEFTDAPLRTLDPMLVAEVTQTQHDIIRLDYQNLGIDADEQQLIADNSLVVHKELVQELNDLKQRRADAEQRVTMHQKTINESNRAIEALTVIAEQSGTNNDMTELIEKLEAKRDEAFVARDQATADANQLAELADQTLTELRKVATVLT